MTPYGPTTSRSRASRKRRIRALDRWGVGALVRCGIGDGKGIRDGPCLIVTGGALPHGSNPTNHGQPATPEPYYPERYHLRPPRCRRCNRRSSVLICSSDRTTPSSVRIESRTAIVCCRCERRSRSSCRAARRAITSTLSLCAADVGSTRSTTRSTKPEGVRRARTRSARFCTHQPVRTPPSTMPSKSVTTRSRTDFVRGENDIQGITGGAKREGR